MSDSERCVSNDNLKRNDVDANETSHNNEGERQSSRPKSNQSASSIQSLSVLLRVNKYHEKIYEKLGRIYKIIENPIEFYDAAEYGVRQKRMSEFINRFSRNHLYQIGRSAEALHNVSDNPIDVIEKVTALFYIIMQAVQSYAKNVETFIFNKCPDKLLVLVDFVINASKICFDRKIFDTKDLMVMKMLKRCAEIREFLMKHQRDNFHETANKVGRKRGAAIGNGNLRSYARQIIQKTTLPPKAMNSRHHFCEAEKELSDYSMKVRGKPKFNNDYYDPVNEYQNSRQKQRNLYESTSRKQSRQRKSSISFEKVKSPYETSYNKIKTKSPLNHRPGVKQTRKNIQTNVKSSENSDKPNVKSKESSTNSNAPSNYSADKFNTRQPQNTALEPILRKTSSHISTAVEKEFERENDIRIFPGTSEKTLEGLESQNHVEEMMKIIHNITKEKFNELIAPILSQLVPNNLEEMRNSCRVKSDIEPIEKPTNVIKEVQSQETVDNVSRNVQYLYVEKINEDQENTSDKEEQKQEVVEPQSMSKKDRIKIQEKPLISSYNINKNDDSDDSVEDCKLSSIEEMRKQAVKERLATIERMSKNQLYENKYVNEPWNLFSKISDKLLDDMLGKVMKEFGVNEEEIINNFVNCELAFK